MKIFFPVLMIAYFLLNMIFFFRFDISYWIVKVRPELVEIRDLTYDERKSLDRAQNIRIQISETFMYSSLFVGVISFVVRRLKIYNSNHIINVIIVVSVVWSVLLILVKETHFIPTAPLI